MGVKSNQFNTRGPFLGEYVSGKYSGYHTNQLGDVTSGPPGDASDSPKGHEATGGAISDWADPTGAVYRTHVFTESNTFDITSLSTTYPAHIEYLVVGGGGGGCGDDGGGGGGGGLRTNIPTTPLSAPNTSYPVSATPYTVIVGGAGNGAPGIGNRGGNSEFYPGPASYPSTAYIRAVGGGAGNRGPTIDPAAPGGSGGGGGWAGGPTIYGAGNDPADPNFPQPMGNPGGASQAPGNITAGGGGGAGAAGDQVTSNGGAGIQVAIAGPPTDSPIGTPGPSGQGWFSGGGGGGGREGGPGAGGAGGGGQGGNPGATATTGTMGSGGGGGGHGPGSGRARNGGSGVVAVRYQIGTIAPSAKASGGMISLYNGKWIHVFTASGDFNVSSGPVDCEFFMVGGGGGGGFDASGGGGAGEVLLHPNIEIAPGPHTVTIGGGGTYSVEQPVAGSQGGDSTFVAGPVTYTAERGGGGGSRLNSGGTPGGSGGGGGRSSGSGGSASSPSPNPGATPYGNAGGSSGPGGGAGGGGGGAAGESDPTYDPLGSIGGHGGIGIQAPATFRNPDYRYGGSIAGATTIAWGFGGGGGGGYASAQPAPRGGGLALGGSWTGSATSPLGPHYGGGDGAYDPNVGGTTMQGGVNTGGGGGGGNNSGVYAAGGSGGSGIFLIAYPD